MPRVTKDPEERKNEIVDTAIELFSSKGFEQTSVSEIVKKVGVAQGLFYYYFKSKDDLLSAIIERFMAQMVQMVEEIAQNKDYSAGRKLQEIVKGFLGFAAGREHLAEYAHQEKNAGMHQLLVNQMMSQLLPLITDLVVKGIEEGIFDTPYPEETVEMLLAGMNEALHQCIFSQQKELFIRKLKASEELMERALGATKGTFKFL